jgi:hypothetical protein
MEFNGLAARAEPLCSDKLAIDCGSAQRKGDKGMDYEVHILIDTAEEELKILERELASATAALEEARGHPAGARDLRNLELLCEDLNAHYTDLKGRLDSIAESVARVLAPRYGPMCGLRCG